MTANLTVSTAPSDKVSYKDSPSQISNNQKNCSYYKINNFFVYYVRFFKINLLKNFFQKKNSNLAKIHNKCFFL